MQTRVWAIADTHLSFGKHKDMQRFGEEWIGHPDKLATTWKTLIGPDDVVLLAGDISWAQSVNKIYPDLDWLAALPGRKVLLRGNHDHWWKDIYHVRKIVEPRGFYALEGDSLAIGDVVICGAMGHIAPEDPYFVEDPKKDRYTRELKRLEHALQNASAQKTNGQPVILMMHYPPFTSDGKPTAYVELINQYRPTFCLYGHLHYRKEWELARIGMQNGVSYQLIAADFLGMTPRLIWPVDR